MSPTHDCACPFPRGGNETAAARRTRACVAALFLEFAAAVLGTAQQAHAHGIVGNRVFPGTLSFEDPAVMDELVLTGTSLKHSGEGNDVTDNAFNWSFSRLLTETVSLTVGNGFVHRDWGDARRSGFDETAVMVKTLLYQSDVHEIMVSAGIAGAIGRSGAIGVGANQFSTVLPGVFFGKGFGEVPDALAWARPFALTGALSVELPTSRRSTALDNSTPGELAPMSFQTDTILHWGLSLQYSTFYLTPRFTAGTLPKDEPLDQFIPLVEFAFDTPVGKKTAATINPGIAYVADKYQIAAEAILPLNNEAGHTAGVRAQLLLFTDDLIPSLFGKPLLSR